MSEMEQNRQELIDWLLQYAKKHHIVIESVKVDPDNRPVSLKKHRFVVINMNWRRPEEIPFMIGHEIGHIMFSDNEISTNDDPNFYEQNSEEDPVDLFSVKLIYKYSCNKDDCFEEPGLFMQAYGIPDWMASATRDLFKQNY